MKGALKGGGNGYTCGDIGEVTARHGKRNEKNLLPFCLKKSCSGHHVALHRFNSSVRTTRSKHIDCCVCVWCPVCVCLQQTLLQEMTSKATTGSDNYRHIALLLFEERIYIQGATHTNTGQQ